MKNGSRVAGYRVAAVSLAACLTFILAGDRGITASNSGIDPLEVLNLSVRANAIVVLDTSGSMAADPAGDTGATAGDDPSSKLAIAKSVLNTVIQNNQTKVSFSFGIYTQPTTTVDDFNNNRFVYTTLDANTATAASGNPVVINTGGSATSSPGLKRVATDTFVDKDGNTAYRLYAGKFFNGETIRVRTGGQYCTSTAGTTTSPATVSLQVVSGACGTADIAGALVTFTLQGALFSPSSLNSSCNGYRNLVPLFACTVNDQITAITPHLRPELLINANGTIAGYVDGTLGNNPTSEPTAHGLRAAGATPIANALDDIRTTVWGPLYTGTIAAQNPKQRTFVIFVTDGDDTCPGENSFDQSNVTTNAARAALSAQTLNDRINSAIPESSVTTFLVALGAGVSQTQANWIAWGGSGLKWGGPGSVAGTNDLTKWTTPYPTVTDKNTLCPGCQDAFLASDATALATALESAISLGQTTGEFSDQQSITQSVFEYTAIASAETGSTVGDPLDPQTRYTGLIPLLLQTTFVMPNFDGHLKAFRNVGGSSVLQWDAGQKLYARVVTNGIATCAGGECTFAELHGNATPASIEGSTAKIKRRIFTTDRNGAFTPSVDDLMDNVSSHLVPLWPPTTANGGVTPNDIANPAGQFDAAFGLTTLTFVQLQASPFYACTGATPFPTTGPGANCASAGAQVAQATREAREVIVAFTAGAQVSLDATGLAKRDATGNMLFKARSWIMGDSTLSSPAVVTPPIGVKPSVHAAEYALFRDGPRSAAGTASLGVLKGFGMRNPDRDDTAASASNASLKPVMSVIYHPTNHALHALRAGPQATTGTSCAAGVECGGDELWAFVPYDQLSKLRSRLTPQVRNPHTYVLAAPVRFADIFVPGSFSRNIGGVTVAGTGVWRKILFFGRGAGGKYLTALDVTAPGPFTATSLSAQGPIPLWNRGNPDTQDGSLGGAVNHDAADYDQYLHLGETWSVPALGRVDPAQNTTVRTVAGVEFAAWLGSGYSDAAGEGSRFFTLDPLTGDVVRSYDVGDRAGMAYKNVIVAGPAAYVADQLRPGELPHPASSKATRVYVGDIHGRLWKFLASSGVEMFADFGSNQPIGVPVALLAYKGSTTTERPHVFGETGQEKRIFPPPQGTPPFKIFGLRDDCVSDTVECSTDPDLLDGVTGTAKVQFVKNFDDGSGRFRGTAQPATGFNSAGDGRVFFVGTRFNLSNASCVSSFDTILFALAAESGGAAYDLNAGAADESLILTGERVQNVRVNQGDLILDQGIGAQNPPAPPAPPVGLPPDPAVQSNVYPLTTFQGKPVMTSGSSVCKYW